jgi:hypothetical protein
VTDERSALKTEQLERIKQRDNFLNLNIVAVGVVAAVAVQSRPHAAAWLVVPWVTVVLGWAYLSNDDKVTAIGQHVRASLDQQTAEESWEASEKGLLPPAVRRVADAVVFLLSFVLPTPVALALYVASRSGTYTWSPTVIAITSFDVVMVGGLGAAYAISLAHRR